MTAAPVLATDPAADAPAPTRAPGLFAALGVHGLDSLDAVLLAALATEEPLLLIGPHGTGKTLLLTRIAAALALEFRHYNASLLNFDDLVGFPLPGRDGTLEYVRTPAAIWGAEAVLFDEVSRCRPDVQNKLFPIVHERRVQGLPLAGLRFRWAAMNPPPADDDAGGYVGAEPLDAALADRFPFVVAMPAWEDLGDDDQVAIITAAPQPVDAGAARRLARRIEATRTLVPPLTVALESQVATWVRVLHRLLDKAGLHLSPRRAAMLCRAAIAVHAARVTLDTRAATADSLLLALRHGLPQRAEGRPVAEVALLAAHREAWRSAEAAPGDPMKAILLAPDPLARLRLVASSRGLDRNDRSGVVADSLALLAPGARAAAVVYLFESGTIGRLNAAVAEQVAASYRDLVQPVRISEVVHGGDPLLRVWQRLQALLAELDPTEPRAHLCANALAAAFARREFARPEEVERAFREFRRTDDLLAAARPA